MPRGLTLGGRPLSDRSRATLLRALEIADAHPSAGIFPRGSNQARRYERLVRDGVLVFAGWGRDAEGRDNDPDVRLYQLTDAGRVLANALRDEETLPCAS